MKLRKYPQKNIEVQLHAAWTAFEKEIRRKFKSTTAALHLDARFQVDICLTHP